MKKRNRRRSNRRLLTPRTADQYFAMSRKDREKYQKATKIVSDSRAIQLSPRELARRQGIDFRAFLRRVGSALRKSSNGRYVARSSDRLLRVLVIPTPQGLREIALRDSRAATEVAHYWNAVELYLGEKGDASELRKFDGVVISDADGNKFVLLTDTRELDRLASFGVLSFETIYAKR